MVSAALPRGERLHAIRGAIPGLANLPEGCRFHPRCPRASRQCQIVAPPLQAFGSRHVACWHPHAEVLPTPIARDDTAEPEQVERKRLVEVVDLHKHYRLVRAVDGVTFHIGEGETFGLVGESCCGKSTLARVLLQLERASSGQVNFDGRDLTRLGADSLRRARRDMQMVFQDPYGSIDPRWTIERIIAEPLAVHEDFSALQQRQRVDELLEQVGLDASWRGRYPHQLSGGQRQRIAIARAIALQPRFVLADEAVSALDVSVQAQMINLLQDLKERLQLTYLFIGHGLHLVRHVSDRIGVMHLGRLVEAGPAEALFRRSAHHYTRALVAAIPEPDPTLRRAFVPIPGEIPSAARLPTGCRFHTRCAAATARCRTEDPPLVAIDAHRAVACHFPL